MTNYKYKAGDQILITSSCNDDSCWCGLKRGKITYVLSVGNTATVNVAMLKLGAVEPIPWPTRDCVPASSLTRALYGD